MKTILTIAAALTASSCFAALSPATGDRLTDYTNWFAPFRVASDSNQPGIPSPRTNFPNATQADTADRDWSGFSQNWGATSLVAPTFKGAAAVTVEIVFLGESAGWWNDLGYVLNGTHTLLGDGLQAAGGRNVTFGSYAYLTINPGDELDFFMTGSGSKKQDGGITIGSKGGIFYTYDKSMNTGGSVQQSYYGTLDPLRSVRSGESLAAYTVFGFEDTRITAGGSDRDYNDMLFAIRYIPSGVGAVPEPATFGVLAAVALLGLAEFGRRRRLR